MYVCERSEQEKIRLFKIEKKNQQQKTVAAAKNHINKKNYSMKYHVILERQGAQWLSGRVLDSRPKGRGFEPHRRHCVVVLEQDTFILA